MLRLPGVGSTWKLGVKAVVELNFRENTFLSGSDPCNLFGGRIPKCKVLAIRLWTEHGCGL